MNSASLRTSSLLGCILACASVGRANAASTLLTDERRLAFSTAAGGDPSHPVSSDSQSAIYPGFGGAWNEQLGTSYYIGDLNDTEVLYEASVDVDVFQSSVIQPTHFQAYGEIQFLLRSESSSDALAFASSWGDAHVSLEVSFQLTDRYQFDFSGNFSNSEVVLREEGGGDVFVHNANTSGLLLPGVYVLEARADVAGVAEGGIGVYDDSFQPAQFYFQLDLFPSPVPDDGSTALLLAVGFVWVAASGLPKSTTLTRNR